MSPEALARLRKMVTEAFDGSPAAEQMLSNGPVAEMMTDLRALLDAHTEALDALEACIRPGADFIETFKRVEAVLAKAGRR